MSRGYNRARRSTPPPKGGGIFWSTIVAMIIGAAVFALAPREDITAASTERGSVAVESYPLCTSEPDYGNAPCVVLSLNDGVEGYTWVTVAADGTVMHVPMARCISEDGPAPCVWDTTRGNGRTGPGVAQFVMVRN